jgi:hypothetical protein
MREAPVKRTDVVGVLYIGAITAFIVLQTDLFISLTEAHPYPMGFAKIALLATFGECLKHRLTSGSWIPRKMVVRFLVWGMFGLWFTAAFPFVAGGVQAISATHLWFPEGPFWMSLWINLLGGYAFFMMFTHYWLDTIIANKFCWPWEVLGKPETSRWAKIVFISLIVFWIPAHTITFSLPPALRVTSAAYLAIALGIILSFAARRN